MFNNLVTENTKVVIAVVIGLSIIWSMLDRDRKKAVKMIVGIAIATICAMYNFIEKLYAAMARAFYLLAGYPVMGVSAYYGYKMYQVMMAYDQSHRVVGHYDHQAVVIQFLGYWVLLWAISAICAFRAYESWGIIHKSIRKSITQERLAQVSANAEKKQKACNI